MLAPKVNKKKNAINIAVLLAIFIVIGIIVYQNFLANKFSGDDASAPIIGGLNTSIKPVPKIKKDDFQLDVLDDEKFLNLVEFEYERKPLEELKVGKEDPFEIDELLEVANKNSRR